MQHSNFKRKFDYLVIGIYLELGIWLLEFCLFQLLIIFHVEPHGEKEGLKT